MGVGIGVQVGGERAASTSSAVSTSKATTELSHAADRMRAYLEKGDSARALDVFEELGVGTLEGYWGKGRSNEAMAKGGQERRGRGEPGLKATGKTGNFDADVRKHKGVWVNAGQGRIEQTSHQDKARLYQMADACDFALRAYANLGMPDPAARLVSAMWQRGIPVGRVANSSVVKALCEAGRMEEALKYLKSVSAQRSDIVGYNVLFTALRHRMHDEGSGINSWGSARASDARTRTTCSHEVHDLGVRTWAVLEKKMEKNSKLRPDVITWSAAVRILGADGRGAHGKRLSAGDNWYYARWLEVADEYSLADRTSVAASYVGGLCSAREFEKALETCICVLDEVLAAGCLPVEVVDGNVMERDAGVDAGHQGAHQDGLFEPVCSEKGKKHASPVSNARVACNTVLHASVATSNDSVMDRLVHAMMSRGLTPDTVTYNALLRRSLRRREGSLAIKEGLAEMQRMGLVPDQTSVEILIQSHALQGQIEDAERAVEVIIDEYGVESGRAWGTLMAACGMAGDVENVAHVFARAVEYCEQRHTERHDPSPFEHLAVACLKALHEALGKEYWRRVMHAPVAVAQSLSSASSGKEALFMYLEEVALGLLKDVDDLVARKQMLHAPEHDRLLCLAALGKAEEVMAAVPEFPLVYGEDRMMQVLQHRSVSDSPKATTNTKASPSVATNASFQDEEATNVLLHALARLGKLEHCFGLIQQHAMELSSKEYASLIQACAAHSPPMEELARRLLAHARQRGIPVDTRFYNGLLLVRARLEGLDGVHDGMDEMRARGVEPNVFSYFVLREAAVLAKDTHAAESALEKIKDLQQGYTNSSRTKDSDQAHGARGSGPWRGFYALEYADDDW